MKRSSRRSMRGGWQRLTPMGTPVNDTSMKGPTMVSDAQGGEYRSMHEGQHGGASLGEGAAVGDTGVLDSSMRVHARVTPIDQALSETAGMRDQSGGRRRRRSMRKKRGSRRRSMRKKRGSRRRSMRRKHGGGVLMPASADAHGMILPASAGAEAGMNPEWKLAANPTSFIPHGVRH